MGWRPSAFVLAHAKSPSCSLPWKEGYRPTGSARVACRRRKDAWHHVSWELVSFFSFGLSKTRLDTDAVVEAEGLTSKHKACMAIRIHTPRMSCWMYNISFWPRGMTARFCSTSHSLEKVAYS